MSKTRIKYIHIFIWLFAIFANFPYSGIPDHMSMKEITTFIIAFLYLMLVFYVFYLFLVPFFLNRKMIGEFFGFSFLIVLIMPFIGYTILYFNRALFEGTFRNFYQGYSLKMHMSGYFPVLTASVSGSFFRVIVNWFTTLNQKAEVDKQKLVVELDLLKSKLNPHFLFNTLNNIDSLIHHDPGEASAALIKLAGIMRYLTYETSAEKVNLSKEVEYIRNFIELYRIRIKSPEAIGFEVNGDLDVLLAPALFVPLLENAFKFASFRNKGHCVDINLSSDSGIVIFEVSNMCEKISNASKSDNSGFGILNLKKRLELIYPLKHQLQIEPGESRYSVKLLIDTNAN